MMMNTTRKKMCKYNICKFEIKHDKDGLKECGYSILSTGSTTHLNEHLFTEHNLSEFRPKRLTQKASDLQVNTWMAKFIVSSNSAFRICDDNNLKVLLTLALNNKHYLSVF
jgi:hypothetical protein